MSGDREQRREEIKLILEYIKTAIALSTLVGVALAVWQWSSQNEALRLANDQKLEADWKDHLLYFVKEPDLHPYFFEGKQVDGSDPLKRSRVIAMADVRLELIDNIYGVSEDIWTNTEIAGWISVFHDAFRSSPIMCERAIANQKHYDYIVSDVLKDQIGPGKICPKI
ncbi:hypothetical protein ACQKQD_03560 [Methylobacterium sp. NPDC080182]|uniref:hypothetical protein n=1 Tax=Methylobacterium sp. NPDC080182 TaxID=3390590 RepID=UPI003D087BC3